MNFYLYLIILSVSLVRADLKFDAMKIKHYEIEKDVFVTGVHHKSKDNFILLNGYTTHKKVKIQSCKVVYNNVNNSCSAKYNKYRRMKRNYFDIVIKYNKKIRPKSVILNGLVMNIPRKVYNHLKYVVCSPVMFNYTKANYLIQRMESLLYFGVSKVVTYYIDTSIEVEKVLKYYIRKGFLDVYRYDKHLEYDIWRDGDDYYGQIWKFNHCFHRYQENAKYIMNFDLDETLWPVTTNNYDELFKILPSSDVYYFDVRVFFTTKDINVKLKDADMFNITDTCTGKVGYCRKYVVGNTLKYYGLEVHTAEYHYGWFAKEIKVDKKYAFVRHTKGNTKTLNKYCYNKEIYPKDNASIKIDNKSKFIKKLIFNSFDM